MASDHKQMSDTHGSLRHQTTGGIHFLERVGTGPALVFLHGIGSNSDSFTSLFEIFPEGPRLLAWNAPGYLNSKPLAAARPTAAEYAEALEKFFDNLGLRKAVLVGHSMGTLIAVAFALRAPARVSALILSASAQGYGIDADAPLPTKAAARLSDLETEGVQAFASARAPRLVHNPNENPAVVARVCQEMARINPGGYAQAVHMLSAGNLAASVAQLRIRPDFVIGADDQVTPMDQTHAAMRAWENAQGQTPRSITIADVGHALHVQAPRAFCDALIDLLPDIREYTTSHAEGELHGGRP